MAKMSTHTHSLSLLVCDVGFDVGRTRALGRMMQQRQDDGVREVMVL